MVRPADAAQAVARMVELRAVEPAFPFYGTLELRGGQPYSHALLRGPRRAGAAGAAGAARTSRSAIAIAHRQRSRSRFAASSTTEPGRRVGAFSLGPARAHRSRRPRADRAARVRQPRAATRCCCRCPTRGSSRCVARRCARDSRTSSSTRGRTAGTEDDIGEDLDARRELPEPGRPRDRDPRRHRRLERHARLRRSRRSRSIAILKCVGATTAAGPRRLHAAGAGARAGRQPARRRARAPLAIAAIPSRSAAVGAGAPRRLRPDRGRRWCRASAIGLLVSLLFSLVPLLESGTSSRRCCCGGRRAAGGRRDRLGAASAVVDRSASPRRSSASPRWQAGSLRSA